MDIASGVGLGIGVLIYFIFIIGMFGVSIFALVLFIKLALRGIKVLDIYIAKEKTEEL